MSSRTRTESRPSCYLHGSDRQWHIFNLFSNHVRFKRSPALFHFGLKSVCCCVCLNLCPCWETEERLEASASAGAQLLLYMSVTHKWAAVFLCGWYGLDTDCGSLLMLFCCLHMTQSCSATPEVLATLVESSPDWFGLLFVALMLPWCTRAQPGFGRATCTFSGQMASD